MAPAPLEFHRVSRFSSSLFPFSHPFLPTREVLTASVDGRSLSVHRCLPLPFPFSFLLLERPSVTNGCPVTTGGSSFFFLFSPPHAPASYVGDFFFYFFPRREPQNDLRVCPDSPSCFPRYPSVLGANFSNSDLAKPNCYQNSFKADTLPFPSFNLS